MNMQVAKNTVVTLDYSVTDFEGELVDAGQEPLVYLHGGYDDIFPMIEEAVHGKRIGESVVVRMQPDDAFGEYDATLVQLEPRSQFPDELQVGMQFEGIPEGGDEDDDEDVLIYRVTEIAADKVVLDGNHPLAGMALIFTCTVTAVRPATADEIRHGHTHDDDQDDED
ncbi:MAG: FKBP-type peptidyl-prolyl cis-trans isomerase SlyD [Candidatus Accumulibacter adjunctus]|jgi:FKBP-type peptidyl-prolyl cis-trans isomerase SlyD|uniref:peptidylprolyl isomerase n=2 Tax=Candidatus Accumulibacter TaxID=327159 RepID=A0A011MYJ9_9PROT|nr:MAG: FKBP-type peptidyl-prolyl cis-trans isomerase SlyD [Candidatus Accumulibacter adjunctus]